MTSMRAISPSRTVITLAPTWPLGIKGYRRNALLPDERARLFVTEGHLGQVADPDRHTVANHHYRVFDRLGRFVS